MLLQPIGNTDFVECTAISFVCWFFDQGELNTTNTTHNNFPEENVTTTVLVSKTSGRYRVQSTSLSALWLVLEELTSRLESHWLHKGGIKVTYAEQLPLSDYYAAVDRHYFSRRAVRHAEAMLNDSAHQFRIIQKRLLVRFKDGRPASLDKLDLILWQTHRNLLSLASRVEFTQNERDHAGHILACGTQLLLSLMRMRFPSSSIDFGVLRSHLSPAVLECTHGSVDESLSGWEETTDAALTCLLKTSLSKASALSKCRNQEPEFASKFNVPPVPLTFPMTTDRLKRHIAMVCDRLEHGQTSTGKGNMATSEVP